MRRNISSSFELRKDSSFVIPKMMKEQIRKSFGTDNITTTHSNQQDFGNECTSVSPLLWMSLSDESLNGETSDPQRAALLPKEFGGSSLYKRLRSRSFPCWILALIVFLITMQATAVQASDSRQPSKTRIAKTQLVLHPFWQGQNMDREPALFAVAPGAESATARLLFVPTRIIRVTSGDGRITYDEGKDYLWTPGSDILTLTPSSRVPVKTWAQLYPPIGAPQSLGEAVDGRSSVFFAEGGEVFQRLQVAITYQHDSRWSGYVPNSAGMYLKRTIAKLQTKKAIKLVVLGDSISEGACASSTFGGPPYQSPYVGLVADGLREKYKDKVVVKNLSVGGNSSNWGASRASKVAAKNPDLVILAFGMNDASGRETSTVYDHNIREMMTTIRRKRPNVDFILVATMMGNPEWSRSDTSLYMQYRDDLMRLSGPGVAVADLTSMWGDLLKSKKYVDLTGNGVNHPNDFGHRVYAEVILELL